jgi:SAM-dependent methyltransferase
MIYMKGVRMLSQDNYNFYVCPSCKNHLEMGKDALHCQMCKVAYPIVDNIPDFILEDLSQNDNPTLRGVKSIDRLARIYESKWWYPLVLNLYGGRGCISLEQLLDFVGKIMEPATGRILDVACGPGTFGRRVASPSKTVYGIDISMGMLQQGLLYTQEEHIPNAHFARAKVEKLPFGDQSFDGAICCGSLHLFADTVVALQETSRTLKAGALLAVFTFAAGDAGILRFRRIREHVRQDHGVHIFEIPELEQYLNEAEFEMFESTMYGSVLTFSARKYGGDGDG